MNYSNFDLTNMVTPVKPRILKRLLQEAHFPRHKIKKLVSGFTHGFKLHYEGDKKVHIFSDNLKLYVGDKRILWNKVMKEVKEKRFAGPFKEPPFKYFIQSPIGLVAKDQGRDTRLIFHLSHPRANPQNSVNANIPRDKCKVNYASFDQAIALCIQAGICCNIAKSDMKSAFRHLNMRVKDYCWLVMKAESPLDGKTYFFVDKCLSFGSSVSCKHFQDFSDGIAAIVMYRIHKPLVNYLDDFFFAALWRQVCNAQVSAFLEVCRLINFPVSMEKTFWGTTILTFLGLLINTVMQTVSIPADKIEKAKRIIESVLPKRKITMLNLQEITGFLNFLCKAVVPGRAFSRRLYDKVNSRLRPHHHINLTRDMKEDLRMWLSFLEHPSAYCRPFSDFQETLTADQIMFYSDASKNPDLGFGIICEKLFICQRWDREFMLKYDPSIQYLELYAVTVGVVTWMHRYPNRRIILFCDNQSSQGMINKNSTKCKQSMALIRLIILTSLKHNVRIFCNYVDTKSNGIADSLSRMQFDRFKRLAPAGVDKQPTPMPEELWPMEKVWVTY